MEMGQGIMILAFFVGKFIPALIAIFAILVLACPKASVGAIVLFLQSILININLLFIDDVNEDFLSTSMLLSFVSMINIGNNIYLERSYKDPHRRPAKFNIIIGIILILLFWFKMPLLSTTNLTVKNLRQESINIDEFTLIFIAFSIFTILVSSFAIIDIKQRGTKTIT